VRGQSRSVGTHKLHWGRIEKERNVHKFIRERKERVVTSVKIQGEEQNNSQIKKGKERCRDE